MNDYWDQPIEILSLGAKELGALRRLKVKNFGQLRDLKLEKVLALSGYGEGTYRRLQNIKAELIKKEESGSLAKKKDCKLTFDEIVWKLSARTQHTLGRLDVNSINDLLGITDQEVLDCRGAGRTVLSEIRHTKEKLNKEGYYHQSNHAINDKLSVFNAIKALSNKAQEALKALGVKYYEDLLNVSKKDIMNLNADIAVKVALGLIPSEHDIGSEKDMGVGVWEEIKSLQKDCNYSRQQIPTEQFDTPANEVSVKLLPLFSGQKLTISDIDLHSSYLPYLKCNRHYFI